jgi:hypothetical protein
MIDARLLAGTGTLAIDDIGGALRLTPTEGATRLWSPRATVPENLPRLLALGAQ